MKYRAEIDGLRALAVLPVILFHAGFEWFSGGFVGVDVFFVISGYLITTIIISEMAEGKFSIVNFYERRARRILPALFFVLVACLPFAWLWLTPADLKEFGQSLVAVTTFSSNILFWWQSGYFDTAAELKPLLHTWSLAVEEQYYILFPIFLMFTWRLGIKWVLLLLSVLFVTSLGLAVWATQYAEHPKIITGAFFLLPTRGWELLIGVFAAFYLKYRTHIKSHTVNQALSLLGFGMIVYSILAFDENTPFPSLYALIPTVGAGLLIMCAVPKTVVHNLLSLKFFVGIGLISYSAYLWHQPLFAFARHRSVSVDDLSESILITLCLASLLLAWISWKFVEAPFRDKKAFTRKNIFLIFSITALGLSVLGLCTHMKFLQTDLTFDRNIYDKERNEFRRNQLVDANVSRSSLKRYAIVGDSMWKDAVNILGFEGSFEYIPYQAGGCPPNNEYEKYTQSKQCLNLNKKRFSEDFSVFDGVVVISRYNQSKDENYLKPFLSYLNESGVVNVLVFGPYIGFENQTHFLDRLIVKAKGKENLDRFVIDNNLLLEESYDDTPLSELVSSFGFSYVSMYDKFCEPLKCPIFIGDVPFTYDVHHFTLEFSEIVSSKNTKTLSSFLSK
jgi:peptidoglycan/LPS O-acetylase OafA/YrhL